MHKSQRNILLITVCSLLVAVVFQANAQGVDNLTPAPAEICINGGEYSLEVEPKVKYVTLNKGTIPSEAYRLKIDKRGVTISSCDPAGAFYARQTLDQMLMGADGSDVLPYCEIYDYPRFRYRGLHFDVSRHFRSIDFLKKQIDAMAAYKMNRMHIHLTDAAGWRMQIDSYPRLHEFAAWRHMYSQKEGRSSVGMKFFREDWLVE